MFEVLSMEVKSTKPIGKMSRVKNGFTLVELLIVMTVLAALATVVLVTYPAARGRARDARRKSDIKQYQTAMELYYNRQSAYLAMAGNLATSGNCTNLNLTSCTDDPLSASGKHYQVSSSATAYLLWAELENPPTTTTYFYTCSTGEAGETTTNPGSSNPC